jgi:hypothetical protein
MTKERLLEGHRQEGDWIFVPLEDLTTPQPGRIVYGPRWWAVTEAGEVLFYKRYTSPQCNSEKTIIERVLSQYEPVKTTAQFIPLAYLPHRCSDYA